MSEPSRRSASSSRHNSASITNDIYASSSSHLSVRSNAPASSIMPLLGAPSQRRDPRVSSCDACYRAKTKCDGADPCEKCAKRGKSCSYDRVQNPDSFKRNPRSSSKKSAGTASSEPSVNAKLGASHWPAPPESSSSSPSSSVVYQTSGTDGRIQGNLLPLLPSPGEHSGGDCNRHEHRYSRPAAWQLTQCERPTLPALDLARYSVHPASSAYQDSTRQRYPPPSTPFHHETNLNRKRPYESSQSHPCLILHPPPTPALAIPLKVQATHVATARVSPHDVECILNSTSIKCSERLAKRIAHMVNLRLRGKITSHVSDRNTLCSHLVSVYFVYVHPFLPRLIDPFVFLPRFFDGRGEEKNCKAFDGLVAAMCANACRFSMHPDLAEFQCGKDEEGLLRFAAVFADKAAESVDQVDPEGSSERKLIRIQTLVLLSWWGTWGLKGEKMSEYLSRALREVQLSTMKSEEWSAIINGPPDAIDSYRAQLRRMLPTLLTFDYQTSMFAGMLCNVNESDTISEIFPDERTQLSSDIGTARPDLPSNEQHWRAMNSRQERLVAPFDEIRKEDVLHRSDSHEQNRDYYDYLIAANENVWDEDITVDNGRPRSDSARWFEIIVENASPSVYANSSDGSSFESVKDEDHLQMASVTSDLVRQEYQLFEMLCHLLISNGSFGLRANDGDYFFQMTLVTRRVYRAFNTESRLLGRLAEVPLLSPIARTISPPLDEYTLQTAMTEWYCALPDHLRVFPNLAVFSEGASSFARLASPYDVARSESWPRNPIAVKMAGYFLSATAKIHRVLLLSSGGRDDAEMFPVSPQRDGAKLPSIGILKATHRALIYMMTCVYAAHGYYIPNVFIPHVEGLNPETGLAGARWRCGDCRSGAQAVPQPSTIGVDVDLPEEAFLIDDGNEFSQKRIPPFAPFTMRMKFSSRVDSAPSRVGGKFVGQDGHNPATSLQPAGRRVMSIRHLAASPIMQNCACSNAHDHEPCVSPWPLLETMWTSGAVFDITHYAISSTLKNALESPERRNEWHKICLQGPSRHTIPHALGTDSDMEDAKFIVFSAVYVVLPAMMQSSKVWSITSVAGQFLMEALKFALSGHDIGGMAHQNR
ncbi:hypothetical protein BJ742DRAFT_859332 [Cladochytrium replicatum]|nr:hypothetical protein BJ742DRAFT_859332 [Cladochytrium replicatum]